MFKEEISESIENFRKRKELIYRDPTPYDDVYVGLEEEASILETELKKQENYTDKDVSELNRAKNSQYYLPEDGVSSREEAINVLEEKVNQGNNKISEIKAKFDAKKQEIVNRAVEITPTAEEKRNRNIELLKEAIEYFTTRKDKLLYEESLVKHDMEGISLELRGINLNTKTVNGNEIDREVAGKLQELEKNFKELTEKIKTDINPALDMCSEALVYVNEELVRIQTLTDEDINESVDSTVDDEVIVDNTVEEVEDVEEISIEDIEDEELIEQILEENDSAEEYEVDENYVGDENKDPEVAKIEEELEQEERERKGKKAGFVTRYKGNNVRIIPAGRLIYEMETGFSPDSLGISKAELREVAFKLDNGIDVDDELTWTEKIVARVRFIKYGKSAIEHLDNGDFNFIQYFGLTGEHVEQLVNDEEIKIVVEKPKKRNKAKNSTVEVEKVNVPV